MPLELIPVVPGLVRVDVSGDIDAQLAAAVGRAIDAARRQGAEYVTLDLSAVGRSVLELGLAVERAAAKDIRVVVHGAPPLVAGMLARHFERVSPAVPVELVATDGAEAPSRLPV